MTAWGTLISIDSATWIFPQILWGKAKNDNAIGWLFCAINSDRNLSEKIDRKANITDSVLSSNAVFVDDELNWNRFSDFGVFC